MQNYSSAGPHDTRIQQCDIYINDSDISNQILLEPFGTVIIFHAAALLSLYLSDQTNYSF